ncbi:MAG: heavy metal-associated domain-containing protein [Kiritimatiellae bacterium]|nr:heavy metal-associated domain-containing protein [Kiritimatiellia bacterium]
MLLALACCVSACRQTDVRTTLVKVPQVKNAACERQVRAALGKLRGVQQEKLAFDFAAGTVLVKYDSMMLGIKNIEHTIADAGFDANVLSANPGARASLPADCLPAGTAAATVAPPANAAPAK